MANPEIVALNHAVDRISDPPRQPEHWRDIFTHPNWISFCQFASMVLNPTQDWSFVKQWFEAGNANDCSPVYAHVALSILSDLFKMQVTNISQVTRESLVTRYILPLRNLLSSLKMEHAKIYTKLGSIVKQLSKPETTISTVHECLNFLLPSRLNLELQNINFEVDAWDMHQNSKLWPADDQAIVSHKPLVKGLGDTTFEVFQSDKG